MNVTSRRHDLDALRAFAMLVGIALHAALSFMPVPWVVQDRDQGAAFGLFVSAVHGFRMPLFFLLSGFFTAMLWQRRGPGGLIEQRVKRIMLPLILGILTILPLMWVVVIWAGSGNATYGAHAEKDDLWSVSHRGDREALAKLIERGADLDRADPVAGQSPLAWAVIGEQSTTVADLLAGGADASARFRDQNTALHTAAFFGRADCATLLLAAGADVNARNTHGESVLDSLRHDRKTTEWIAGLLKIEIEFESVQDGRGRIRADLLARGAMAGKALPAGDTHAEERRKLRELAEGLMQFPFFHHLWFLWFLCWLTVGFVLVAGTARRLRIPRPPAWLVRSPLSWLWLVPLTYLPQRVMHMHGALPGFGPDTSAGLLPMPHVLLYYSIFFGFGALYFGARDDDGHLSCGWRVMLPAGLLLVLPVGLGLAYRQDWALDLLASGSQLASNLAQVLYVWLMIFGLLGLCRHVFSRERPWVRYVSDSAYWLYLAHLPLVIALQAVVRDWPLPALVKFVLILSVTTGVLFASYRYGVRYTWIGRLLNGPRQRPARG